MSQAAAAKFIMRLVASVLWTEQEDHLEHNKHSVTIYWINELWKELTGQMSFVHRELLIDEVPSGFLHLIVVCEC